MIKKLILILFIVFVYAEDSVDVANDNIDNVSKLVYIKQEMLKDSTNLNYIGEIIGIKYNVIVLDNASIRSIGFLEQKGVELKNEKSSWNELGDGTLENTYYFKIKSKNFTIPTLEVIVENDSLRDSATSQNITLNAIALNTNHPKYVGVVANSLSIQKHAIKKYDEHNNILLLDLVAESANLEDFKLQGIQKQGFESSNFNTNKPSGTYYAIFPNHSPSIEFEYFDLQSQTYKLIQLKNIINQEEINTNQDIAPINKVLLFKNILILVFVFIMLIAFFIRKIPFKLRLTLLILAIILILYLVISINAKESGTLKTDSTITILPTSNSTIIAKIPSNTEVQIISKYNDYYKIITNDNKTGWVIKDNVK